MKTKHIYLLLIFLFSSCDNSSQKIPKWVSITPQMEGKIYAVGISDNGKLLSLVDALSALSQSIQVNVSTSDIVDLSSVNLNRFGDVSISTSFITQNSTTSDTILELSEYVVKMFYGKQNNSMSVTAFISETHDEYKGYNSIVYRNADYSDITKELESVGVVIKSTYQNNTHYYTLLELTESLYQKQMKPKELTDEEIKALYEELEKYIKELK